ncbi:MAG: glycosyltransferase [Lachnospiraceae bacterium]|nr:glycosyltransferase [Lachnospiraceae bacterium]
MIKHEEYPLISVIVPTFERSNLLARALDSIFAQTWKQVEVIVVDDNIPGSLLQKKTLQVLRPFSN